MDNTELTVGWDELTVRLRDRGVRGRHVGLEGGGKLEGWGALGVCRVCYGAMLPLYVSLWGKVGAGPVHSAREHLSWPWEMTWGRQARRNPTNTLGGGWRAPCWAAPHRNWGAGALLGAAQAELEVENTEM